MSQENPEHLHDVVCGKPERKNPCVWVNVPGKCGLSGASSGCTKTQKKQPHVRVNVPGKSGILRASAGCKHTVTRQKSCTTQIILYPLQYPGNSYHIYMVIYTYSIYILDMNMRSGSQALLHVGKSEKSEKSGVFRVLQILYVRV